jgi:hypothetical protein
MLSYGQEGGLDMDADSSRYPKERNILQTANCILFGMSGRLPDSILEHPLAVVLNQLDDLDVPWDLTVVSYRQPDGGLGHAAEITTYRSANQQQGKRAVLAWLKENGLEYRLLTDT